MYAEIYENKEWFIDLKKPLGRKYTVEELHKLGGHTSNQKLAYDGDKGGHFCVLDKHLTEVRLLSTGSFLEQTLWCIHYTFSGDSLLNIM